MTQRTLYSLSVSPLAFPPKTITRLQNVGSEIVLRLSEITRGKQSVIEL
ncbi:MAG: hypothetical protein Q610_ECBC00019G0004 [Escherichia coli DORA_B_14]|nr:MAG: hypothetical protein Q610_ECBC00019G0004 [Escherichia coli DORA_B_14]